MDQHIFGYMNISADTVFRALADNTRLRCLLLLQHFDELCVCELTYALGAAQPKISRHLAQLREAELVLDRRAGQWIYYRINPVLPAWAAAVIEATGAGVAGQTPYAADRAKLADMPNRPGASCCA